MTDSNKQGWKKEEPPELHEVFPEETAYLIAFDLYKEGHLDLAIGILVSLDCYLRIGDLSSLTVSDVSVQDDDRYGYSAALCLRVTKTGVNQSALIRSDNIAQLLLRLANRRKAAEGADSRFRKVHANTIRNRLEKCVQRLNLGHECTPHSFRNEGATADKLKNLFSDEGIMQRGRWPGARTMRHYVRPAQYIRNLRMLTEAQRTLKKKIMANPRTYFNVPAPPVVRDRTDTVLQTQTKMVHSCVSPGSWCPANANGNSECFRGLQCKKTCNPCEKLTV